MALVLGVASMAASTTVEARDTRTGRVVATASVEHRTRGPAEQRPARWWDALVDAIAASGVGGDIAALAVAGQRQALVLLDGAGAPLLPASLRSDTRSAETAVALVSRLGAPRLARATGHVPATDTPLVRLAWLYGTDRALAARTESILGATELLTFRLTGRKVTDRSGASATGWFDPHAGGWRRDLLDRAVPAAPGVGWPSALPELLAPDATADRVSATIHGLVGLAKRPAVASGTTDLAARALALAAGLDADGSPTSGSVTVFVDPDDTVAFRVSDDVVDDPTGRVQGFADATGRHLPTVAAAPVGASLDAIARLLGTDGEGLAALAGQAHADPADDPLVLPRAIDAPGGRVPSHPGSVVGLDAELGPEVLARAALHGAAAELLDAVIALYPEPAAIVLAGSDGARPGLAEALADLTGCPVTVRPPLPSAEATGAAVQAAIALAAADPAELVAGWRLDRGTVVQPNPAIDSTALRERLRHHRSEHLENIESS